MKTMMTMKVLGVAVMLSLGVACTPAEVDDDVVVASETPVQDPAFVEPVANDGLTSATGPMDTFDDWDVNRDRGLDANEFNTRFGDDDRFTAWDLDNDDRLSRDEYAAASARWGQAPGGVDSAGLFDEWDANDDTFLDDDEFMTGTYNTWDADRNSVVDTNEYDAGRSWFGW